jgi:hypothetical protein
MSKGFDAVAWMRERREKIDQEDRGLSWEEKREKMQRLLEADPLWARLKARAVEPSAASPGGVREPWGKYWISPHG